ncbi:tetratricopeptide repeat protein [Algoriphagus sp.]|uniref:tetratricopeptide repeat protein n=1 Tax=Algoriphagus sp. TaxID=1872435 RepID=UPI003F714C26
MNTKMEGNELLDRFFKGKLTEEEKLRLESLLRSDEEFREEFEFQQATREAVIRHKHKELKSFLGEVEMELKDDQKVHKIHPKTFIWKVAAGVALLVAATVLILNLTDTQDSDTAYDSFLSYYSPYPNVVSPITRGEEINPEDMEKAAFIAYESGKYGVSDSLFTRILPYQTDYIQFYKGISKFELGQYDSAIYYFDNYLYSDGTQLRDQAKWYMALSYLVKGDTTKGKEEMIRLRKSSGYKMDEVERILLSLD